ncbi:MAG: thermonuclease family protein [Psychrobacter sp.]|nr:thermonuclease family protein [Psychrobacter sp.]
MRCQAFFLTITSMFMLSACSNDIEPQSEAKVIGMEADRPTLQKKPSSSEELSIGVAPVYVSPVAPIDYSKPPSTDLKETTPANFLNQIRPSRIFGWEDAIHNKPLSELKTIYDFDKSLSTESLVDLISYTDEELAILDNAFSESIDVDATSIYDGDTLLLKKSEIKDHDSFKKDKNGNIKARLMNIDCPELEQQGGRYAKNRLADFLSIPSHTKNNKKPKVKLRFRKNSSQDELLVIATLDFGTQEFSLNRSMVYSGSCFAYAQYNQDRLMLSIESYAEYNKKNMWSQRAALMAKEQWIMPWDFRSGKAN